MNPTLSGFILFIQNTMGIPALALPPASDIIPAVYYYALNIVNQQLLAVGASSPAYPTIYAIAVYNLAADLLINLAPDTAATPTYFSGLREKFKCGQFMAGVISNAGDEATSAGLAVSEGLKNLTIDQLQNLRTPYGRTYLGLASKVGTLWGLS